MFRKVAALLTSSLLLVSACAQEGDEGAVEVKTGAAAVSALRAAPDAAADAGTAAFQVVMAMSYGGETFEIVADGAVDAAAGQMAMTMDMGAMLEQLADSSGEEVPDGFAGAWDMVADGDTFYMRAPVFEMLGVDGWISIDASDLGAGDAGMGLGAGTYDFTQVLESLRGVVGEPEVVGEETIRGVPTTHYRASMNLEEALAEVPEEKRAAVEAQLEQLGDIGGAEVPVDVWIDADDLPRRVSIDMGGMFASLGIGDGSVAMTMEYFDYGEPVDIEVPSADEVVPFTDVMGFGTDLGV